MITKPNKSKVITPMKDKDAERKPSWLSFLCVGVTDQVFSEDARRVFITNLFATVGIIVTFPMSIFALLSGDMALGASLIAIAVLYVANHIYLRYTHNYYASGYFVIYPLYGLMLYLVYTGGINGTGHVWIFCVPVVALFLHGMKQGLIELGIFTLALIFIMFFMDSYFAKSNDHELLKSRILFSFWVVVFLSGIYEHSMSRFNQELKETSAKLKLVAYIDALTGLLNRRGMLQRLEASTGDIHLLLADVDFFKRINDEYGHDVGDYALEELAEIIQSSLPVDGFASRWGGEEFLIAFGGCSESETYSLAEQIRTKVEEYKFTYQDHTFRMTLSIGISVVNKLTPLREAITLADNRLYYAKRAGRNQIRNS